MTTEADLESLISTTLTAIDVTKSSDSAQEGAQQCEAGTRPSRSDEETVDIEVEELLSKLKSAAPKVTEPSSSSDETEESLAKILEGLLTPESILDSMEALSVEMEKFLVGKDQSAETDRYRKQLEIYKAVSTAHKDNPGILEESGPVADGIRAQLTELQSLGAPPPEVVEGLMSSQFADSDGEEGGDLGKEFEAFMKEAAETGGGFPGMSKEDEEIMKQLTRDPNALKNLLGGAAGGKPGDCCIM